MLGTSICRGPLPKMFYSGLSPCVMNHPFVTSYRCVSPKPSESQTPAAWPRCTQWGRHQTEGCCGRMFPKLLEPKNWTGYCHSGRGTTHPVRYHRSWGRAPQNGSARKEGGESLPTQRGDGDGAARGPSAFWGATALGKWPRRWWPCTVWGAARRGRARRAMRAVGPERAEAWPPARSLSFVPAVPLPQLRPRRPEGEQRRPRGSIIVPGSCPAPRRRARCGGRRSRAPPSALPALTAGREPPPRRGAAGKRRAAPRGGRRREAAGSRQEAAEPGCRSGLLRGGTDSSAPSNGAERAAGAASPPPPRRPPCRGWLGERVAAASRRVSRWETRSSFTCREKEVRLFCGQVNKQHPAEPTARSRGPQRSFPRGAHQRGACPPKTHPFALTVRAVGERPTFPRASGRRAEPAAPAVGEKRWGCSIYRGKRAGGREPGDREWRRQRRWTGASPGNVLGA